MPDPSDPSWKFPYATREQIDELRQYFAHFATRLEGWKENPRTHALPLKERRPDIPWFSVPEKFRPQVEDWFQRKLTELKARGVPITRGKIQSLRMNAANFGRQVLTRNRARNKGMYERKKRLWLAYLHWSAAHDRKEIEIAKAYTPSKQLEV